MKVSVDVLPYHKSAFDLRTNGIWWATLTLRITNHQTKRGASLRKGELIVLRKGKYLWHEIGRAVLAEAEDWDGFVPSQSVTLVRFHADRMKELTDELVEGEWVRTKLDLRFSGGVRVKKEIGVLQQGSYVEWRLKNVPKAGKMILKKLDGSYSHVTRLMKWLKSSRAGLKSTGTEIGKMGLPGVVPLGLLNDILPTGTSATTMTTKQDCTISLTPPVKISLP